MSLKQSCEGLRILLVGPYPPPYGGIASHLTTLIPGLIVRGAADISVICFGSRDETLNQDGAVIYYYHPKQHLRQFFSPRNWPIILTTLFKLRGAGLTLRLKLEEAMKAILICNIANQHRSQVVAFYQSDLAFSILPCMSRWKNSRGVVLTVFGELYDNPKLSALCANFMKRLLEKPHAVFSSSHHCACSFSKILGISRKILPVYYGIDLERFSTPAIRESYRSKLGWNKEDIVLVFMGRFTEEMGVGRIIEIGPMLLEQLPQAKFLLAGGKGPLAEAAASFAAKYPNSVRVMHDISFDLQPSIYAASDIVLAPSHDQHACMGMSIKEAMAASRPVIGSLAGGIPEAIVDGETGFLVPLDNTKRVDTIAFCDAILKLSTDAALRKSMGAAARVRAESIFSMENTIDKMGSLFLDVIPS